MTGVVSPRQIAAALDELWSPRVIAELDDNYVKVAKVKGTLAWHSHDREDELFFILEGSLTIEMEERTVVLYEGDSFVVPKGLRHNPIAAEECLIMLIEKKTTQHTGSEITAKTRSVDEQLRPVAAAPAEDIGPIMRVTSEGDPEMPSEMTRSEFIVVLDYHDGLVKQLASGVLNFDEFVSLYDNFFVAFGLDGHEAEEDELQLYAEFRARIAPHEDIWKTILAPRMGPAEAVSRLKAVAATL